MNSTLLQPRKSLNKAFLKIKPNRTEIELFKTNLIAILDTINEKESEEFHKNLVINFLKKTYYDPNYFVNTKGRNDLVIHNGKDAKTNVGVIIEVKSPINKSEMITVANLNGKALQELVLYYMRERITHKNTELKHLAVSNIYEWFIFDAQLFNKLFAENKLFTKQFIDFEEGRLSGKTTDYFYKEIAKPFIEALQHTIEFTHFDIRQFDKPLRNSNKEDDKSLVALFKLLSPEHLLKLSFINDSNSLDKNFYTELLHIIGLDEVKEGGKKLIQRHKEGKRNSGSLLENAIDQLESLDKISRLKNAKQYGDNHSEKLFSVALELTITWVNRILFLKLLEAQLISYHKGDKSYSFLNSHLIKDYDNLNSLFFQVLAKKTTERNDRVSTNFAKVPYLNSSLFEPTDLEHETLFVSQLEDNVTLPLLSNTVIKDSQGKKQTGTKNPLDYFLSFLDAYDFASEGSEDIQEDNKPLINASVLGLIFEKINGYKDGSFFTPSFITMYMCKETIRKAVLQKFNETKNWECASFNELYNKIDDIKEANAIINSIKICDPAVGSGHFLVSALNEIIAIKNDLKVLQDNKGNRLKEYHLEIVNDELMVTDENALPFQYNPNSKESQRIQETLFHEKQTIIENCLFGVDINPNSVKICRLRLWIELLKNAYYRPNTNELETLPNIDINIKCGNSLISRFGLDADLKDALKKSKLSIDVYKNAVNTYRNADSKEQKREMEELIGEIKTNFRTEINANDPKLIKLYKLKGEHLVLTSQTGLFELSKKEETERSKKVKAVLEEIKKLDTDIEEIKSNKIYENAFEWRFEFPDVLNDNGDFVGFDVVIGNPPYGMINNNDIYFVKNYKTLEGRFDLFEAFIEKGLNISKNNGVLKYILPNTILTNLYSKKLRQTLVDKFNINEITNFGMNVFDEATVHTCIIGVLKNNSKQKTNIRSQVWSKEELELPFLNSIQLEETIDPNSFTFDITLSANEIQLFEKINRNNLLKNICHIRQCIKTGNDSEYVKKATSKLDDPWKKTLRGKGIGRYSIIEDDIYLKYGDFLARNWKNKTFYETPKIAIRETGNRIIATLDTDSRYFLSSVYAIYPKEKIDTGYLKCLLGILNSNFATFYIRKIAFDLTEGAFTKVRTNQLGRLPIPDISKDNQQPLIQKVDQILSLKKEKPQADTGDLEKEIDIMVYELYGLTEEEIKIVEGC